MNFRFPTHLPFLAGCLIAAGSLRADEAPPPAALDTLTQEIVAANPELQFYEAKLAAARAAAKVAGTRAAPELTMEIGRRRVTDASGVAAEGATWSIAASQTFEWSGRLALRKAVANHDVALAELGVAKFRAALAARTRLLAFGLAAAGQKAAAVREVADRFTALKETFLAREPAGITPLLETRVIEASELALQRRATAAALEAEQALMELNQLRGVPVDTPQRVSPATPAFRAAPDLTTLLAAARENNFEYRARRLELEQQGFAVRLARHERYPSLTVSPYYEQAKAGERETNFGVGVSVPLPVGARPAAEIDVAKARERQADAALRQTERELERALWSAARTFTAKTEETRRWADDALAKFREAAALADRHYRLGAVPVGTYVELQNSYLDAVEALLDTQQEALEAGLSLQALAGVDFNAVEIKP